MAGWILSGYIGAGKTAYAVRWIAEYMAQGHRVCTNVPIYGWCDHINDLCPMVVSTPLIAVMRKLGWQYQPHQFVYIPYEKMVGNPAWFKLVPAGRSRDDRMLAVIDECSDLFDVNDRDSVRRTDNTIMRECLRFVRLSRHAHVEIVFIMQNEGLTMAALTKLCEHRLKVLNFGYFFEKYHLPFTINKTLVTHTLNHGLISGKSRIIQSNDKAIWASYKSEALQESIGIQSDGVIFDPEAGKLKGWKSSKRGESPMWFKVASCVALALGVLACKTSFRAISLADDQELKYAQFLSKVKSAEQSSGAPCVRPASVSFGSALSSSTGVSGAPSQSSTPAYDTSYGEYVYHSAGTLEWAEFRGCRLDVGGPSEWGDIVKIREHFAIARRADGRFMLLCQGRDPSQNRETFAQMRKDSQ